MKAWANQIADAIPAIKADVESLRLKREFFEKSSHPMDTKQHPAKGDKNSHVL